MITIPFSAAIAFAVALVLTPLVWRIAIRVGAMDRSGALHRKGHAGDIPRLGGVAIICAFYAPLVGLLLVESDVGQRFLNNPLLAYGMLGGGLVIAGLGILDDVRGVRARTKFLVQFIVASAVVGLGFRIRIIALPSLPVIGGLITFPLSILWIVGLTNAVNLIDGLDGLAAGLGLLGLVPIAITALATGNLVFALICCTLAGALLGFLFFNFHPARIFMGDSGSMFLGFILALITVEGSKGPVVVSFLAPVLALGLPIMDTLLAMTRRALLGQPLFAGDAEHIHHRLRKAGLSHRRTVLTMYAVGMLLAVGSLLLLIYREKAVALTLGGSAIVCALLMRGIGYLPIFGLRGRLRTTAEIRERNRNLYANLRTLISELHHTQEPEDVRRFGEQLGTLIGARGGALRIMPASDLSAAASIHRWGEPPEGEPAGLSCAIRLPSGSNIGVLQMYSVGRPAARPRHHRRGGAWVRRDRADLAQHGPRRPGAPGSTTGDQHPAAPVQREAVIMRGVLRFALMPVFASVLACGGPPPTSYPTQQVHLEDTSLGPNDVFDVRVYRQDSMSGEYNVSAEGTISFPLIGVVEVAGKTPRQIESELQRRLANGYLVNPQVSVLVKEYRSRNISIFGQVQKPGRLSFTQGMTIVEAVSQAGGFSPMARKNSVTVTRSEGRKKDKYVVPVESIANGQAPNFFVRPGDIIFVPERLF